MERSKLLWLAVAALLLCGAGQGRAQTRPYIGFVYPAGGKQGTTFEVKLGGQGLEDLQRVMISGSGVSARIIDYQRALGPQEITLLNEQLKELKRSTSSAPDMMMASPMMASDTMMSSGAGVDGSTNLAKGTNLIARIEKRIASYVNRPASAALAHIAYLEVTVDSDAPPGARELRLVSGRGISNPMVFHIGQLPEHNRKPMATAPLQVLGKEELALRKRPPNEAEDQVSIPCTLNGQVASGEVNRYRFSAREGQKLVITTHARQLIPYIADAVPGWFQPVLALYDVQGKEVAYSDDYQFRPDPTILFQVPKDGEYVLAMYDAIYRGREDFVYRITLGELPFVTSIFPLGSQTNQTPALKATGWNLDGPEMPAPAHTDGPGIVWLHANHDGLVSAPAPFALDALPDFFEKEPNNKISNARKIRLPVVINGRIDRKDDWDVFRFNGRSNQTVVIEVTARRLDSPLDSIVKVTDASGNLIGLNDDCEDLGSGLNTHHADSYLRIQLPRDGDYFVHLGDTGRNGGSEYGYRMRVSAPKPDFALRIVPSSLALRGKSSAAVSVHVIRKDGFAGPIKLSLKDAPKGFSTSPTSLSGTQAVARLNIKTDLISTPTPVALSVVGTAKVDGGDVVREAVPAEDRMQAFFWRHLVPAQNFLVLVYDPAYQPTPKRVPPPQPVVDAKPVLVSDGAAKPKFSKQQVAGRLRQLKALYEEGLLTDGFYGEKVAECEAAR
jgi:hypothetical protein